MGEDYRLMVSSGGIFSSTQAISLGTLNPSLIAAQRAEANKQKAEQIKKDVADRRRVLAAEKAASRLMREWSSKSGNFTTQAKFVTRAGNKITLEKEDGKQITLELEKLSEAD